MLQETHQVMSSEPEDILDELGSWWRDVAAGSALAAMAVVAAVMFLR